MTGTNLRSMLAGLKSVRLTVTLLAAAAILAACPTVSRWLEYDRELVCNGQVWRIVTCHLTHCNLDHLLWDALALGVLGVMCERRSRSQYVQCLLVCSVAISAAILAWQPEMLRYRGLSGLDTSLFALLAVGLINDKLRERDPTGLTMICLFVLGLAGKIAFELATGSTVFVDHAAAGFAPAPLAHVVGLLVGAAIGLKRFGFSSRASASRSVPASPTTGRGQRTPGRTVLALPPPPRSSRPEQPAAVSFSVPSLETCRRMAPLPACGTRSRHCLGTPVQRRNRSAEPGGAIPG